MQISCRITSTFIQYVKNTRPEFLPKFLEGLQFDEEYLANPDNWISWELERVLEKRLEALYRDETVLLKIGRSVLAYKSLGMVNTLIKLFTTPERLYRNTPKIARYFTRDSVEIKVLESDRESACIEIKTNVRQTRGACLYNQGMFSVVTEIFGLEPAGITEVQCSVPEEDIPEDVRKKGGVRFGAESCIFRLNWNNSIKGILRRSTDKMALKEAIAYLEESNRKLQIAYEQKWKSEERYRNLMENASDVICFLDSEGVITSINKKGVELSGYPAEEAIGRNFLCLIEEPYRDKALKLLKKTLNGSPSIAELAIIAKGGGRLIASANSTPIYEKRSVVGMMVIARDITMEKEYAARLLAAETFAAKGMIAAEIAHEINNSLANVETGLYIANRVRVYGEYRKDIMKSLLEEIERMSGIVKGILDVYRSDHGTIQQVDINSEILKVINITRRRLSGKGISIKSELSPELPGFPCYPGHIKQILLNLIKNSEEAMRETPDKRLVISTFREDGTLAIRVRDTGAGMSPDVANRISAGTFSSKEEGAGLGLYITRQLVGKYKGRLDFTSRPGEGTTVEVSFPLN